MIPYIIFAILLFILYHKRSPVGITLLLIIFAAMRYDTGWDYMSYYDACTDYDALLVAQLSWGKIWSWWFEFIYDNNIPFIGIGVPAILTNILISLAFWILFDGNKKMISEALLIYGAWPFLYLQSFCIVRQFLAIGVSIFAFSLFYKRKYIISIALYILSVALHTSSIIAVVFPLILNLKKSFSVIQVLGYSVIAVISLGGLSIVLTSLGLMGYADLLESEDNFGGKIGFVYLVLSLFSLIAIAKNKNRTSINAKILSMFSISIIIQFFVYVAPVPSVISRAILYGIIFMPIGFMSSLRINKLPISKDAIYGMMLLFMLVYLVITENSPGATSQYVPYKTIWSIH